MKYGIVVDSGCDINREHMHYFDSIDFTRVALSLDVDNEVMVDSMDFDTDEFMAKMHASKNKIGSAAPSPQDWIDAYEKSDYVFGITITGTLSGSYASARTAMDICIQDNPEKKIFLIDSKSAGPEISLIVFKLAELIHAGLDFDEIKSKITEYQTHTQLLFVLQRLDNLVKNGRLNKNIAGIAGILGLKMLGVASPKGTLELLKKCRGKNSAYDKCVDEMLSRHYNGGKVIISHCYAPEIAAYLEARIRMTHPTAEILIMPTSGLCCLYAEDHGILMAFEV